MRRPWLLPLAPGWGAGTAAKNLAYDRGWLKPRRLTKLVVSVGSLSAGGAGKTPVVLALARLLRERGVEADVLSRGYGRAADTVREVQPDGLAAEFGDEPLEMARAGLRVFVGAERYAAGLLAERVFPEAAVHVLDDGFQHRRLGRALDVVLLTAEDVRDTLLPAGNLRESLSASGRADVVVVREEETDALRATAGAAVWRVRRDLALPDGVEAAFCFCGIARPDGFFAMLADKGLRPAGRMAFADHHAYARGDVARLVSAARAAGARSFVTTAKDAVKLLPEWRRLLEAVGPVRVAELRVTFVDEDAVVARVLALVRG